MANLTYSRELTALLVIDPYNDFISEAESYGTALGQSHRRTTALRICCRS
jgi:hypothetical protein